MSTRLGALVLLGLCTFAACEHTPCDDNYEFRKGTCYIKPPDAAAPVDTAPTADDAGEGADAAVDKFAHYGDECLTTADCKAPTDYCGRPPGAAKGACTHTGCKTDPSVCPPTGWRCMDLSIFDPTLPSVCEKQ